MNEEQKFTGTSLRTWRERMGYSQAAACEQLECLPESFMAWEQDQEPIPRYIALACAALALGITNGDMKC